MGKKTEMPEYQGLLPIFPILRRKGNFCPTPARTWKNYQVSKKRLRQFFAIIAHCYPMSTSCGL